MTKPPDLSPSAIEAIGNTPLVELSRLTRAMDGRILAKLEFFNPGFSKKDRIARQIIEDAQASGELLPGQTVVELTSGNTGTGLAIVCGIKRHPFVAVMSKGNSVERARMMSALGAEVVLVDQLPESVPGQVSGGDLELVEQRTREIVAERKAFRADQFRLRGNFRAHYLNTGPEIIRQSGGDIDVFCDFAGTGGSFAGCAAALKEHNSETKCFLIEPEGAAILSGEPVTYPNHRIQGGGYAIDDLPLLNRKFIDGYIKVSDEQAIVMARRLAREEGIFAGFSSGANVAAAMELLKTEFKGKIAVVLICDSGLKYLSTDLWENRADR
ncbi:MAG: cysteine synthase family protein [Desulfobacterales bacterium]|nr:cysteine synthase family protein [Desulfobacterales bacterium]